MARVVLITGGARSGKSSYAQSLLEELGHPRVYLATCGRVGDPEMDARIRKHQADREGRGWQTIEEPLALADAIRNASAADILVDCLSLWVCNLMMVADRDARALGEEEMVSLTRRICQSTATRGGTVVFVTNEVGLGVVPDNVLTRRYRDLLGRTNQAVAAFAEHVVLMTCGIPLVLKGGHGLQGSR